MAFIPLFCLSHHSPLGAGSCEDLAKRARALGYPALGLCDEGTIAGFHAFDEACRAQGIRPIFGCRLHLDGFVIADERGPKRFPIDFLIQSEQGYRSLARILTQYHDLQERDLGPQKKLSLKGRTKGLWVVLPPDGELIELIRRQDIEGVQKSFQLAVEYFGPDIAIGVDAAPGEPSLDFDLGERVREFADFVQAPCLAAPRFLMADPADAPALEFLKSPEHAPERGWSPPENEKELPALFAETDIVARFPEEDEAVHESGEIARRCTWRPAVNRRIIPVQDFERGFDPNSYLFDLVIRGAAERYGEIREEVKQRINREFEEIKARNLAPFLLLYRQITKFLDESGISRGVGRGAAVASVTAYCLGITRIDPLQYKLAAQPLAADNEVYPPIRIEIPSNAAGKVLEFLRSVYGENHLAQIGRRQDLRRDQMVNELARWAGMTEDERRLALQEKSRRRATGAAQRLSEQAESRHWKRWRNPSFLSDLAMRLSPRPKSLAAVPGKWTLSSEPLEYVFPTVRQASGARLTQIGEDAIDQLGGPRLEFVPHHLLNLLDRARAGAAESAPGVDFQRIPLDDRATFDLLGRGDTIGIPPLENVAIKCLLRKQRPANLLQLLRVKTDASRGRASEKPRELIDELPDTLISYHLAFYKANYPEAYFAALLSSIAEINDNQAVAVRATQRCGLEILPPDINLSGPLCSVFGGKIRLGLLMVRGLGEKALEEILRARLGGHFNSLPELCAGLSPKIINLRILQNLIGAGAFDCFRQSRAVMSATVAKLHRKNKATQAGDAGESTAQHTLFDLTALDEDPPTPAETSSDLAESAWDFGTRVRREREALGFNLMLDPLSRFPNTLEALKPLPPEQVTHRQRGWLIRLAGIVDHADSEGPLVGAEGGCLLDIEGVAVRVSAPLARISERAMERGEPALVIGEVDARDGYPCVEAHGVWRLEDLEEQAAKVATVRLLLEGENRSTIKHLLSLAKLYRGPAKLDLAGYPGTRGLGFRLLARQHVFFCSPFYQGLCKILPAERIELYGDSGEKFAIAVASDESGDGGEIEG